MGCCCKKRKELIKIEENKKEIEISYHILNYKDLEPLKLLGTGSFGCVLLVRFISKNQLFSMLKITHQKEHKKNSEHDLMVKLSSLFLVNIKLAFQDETKLYIVLNFM